MNWPGKASYELRSKVDTALSYAAATGDLRNWGFECDEDDHTVDVNKLFKLFLDPRYVDLSGFAPAHGEAQQWYCDYLACLYHCIMRFLSERVGHFSSKKIEFVFSVPTTWKDPGMMADIERLIGRAGYGKLTNHKFVITLTEAEAAAVYASKQQLQRGDVFLVADCGGGTTDVNVLKVTSAARNRTELEPLHCNEGEAIGSTLIDFKAERMVIERLKLIRTEVQLRDIEQLARRMIEDRFMTYKCSFGSGAMMVPKLPLPIPDIAPGQDFRHAGIENSNVVLTSGDLKRLFDEQIQRIFELIDSRLRTLQTANPGEAVKYLVLSGGLGSSPYVQKNIRDRYERGGGAGFTNTADLSVLLASEPQLAVVHGLVLARIQSLRGGPEVLSTRRSPVSYGVLCRELYDPDNHQGEDVELDPYDKRRYAERQVNWFIKQGQIIDANDGVNHRFRHKIPIGYEREPWRTRIVMSTVPRTQLPRSMRHGAVKQVCTVETVLDAGDMQAKNNKWYHLRKPYNIAEFDIKLLIGTGLHFEIWGKEGRKSKSHSEIEVDWEAPDGQDDLQGDGVREHSAMYPVR
ncbi:hypothetical protein LTR78_007757 [Recurvomyces mirabilis]|uniref:Uncharacterized protein n=1 Tax=Recurvomyces mirabilis TaxID=574656 RepID=A0AAE0WG12_9PEZI|nr:hypothetical protein LTR78_007757 [Recurvomyces mirabilis]KAK5151645.1 hypothetical protein LTS14_009132 [Recurvomyces mirabilis]